MDNNNNKEGLSIGTLASQSGVSVETIRFYQRQGLLIEPNKPPGGIRRYGQADVARIRFVKSAQRIGFSLSEVAQLLSLEDGTDCRRAAEIAAHRLTDVRARLADLARIEAVLSKLISHCHDQRQVVRCPLISVIVANAEHQAG